MAGGANLAETPNWRLSIIFLIIVLLSLFGHFGLHLLEEYFKYHKRKGLRHTLQSLKEELFALGLITLLLIVFEEFIVKICIEDDDYYEKDDYPYKSLRRLLAGGDDSSPCGKGQEALWSSTVLHDIHIFIFLIAIVHLVYAAIAMILAALKVRGWKKWEKLPNHDMQPLKKKWTVKTRGRWISLWVRAFFTQFLETVDGPIYLALRRLFIERMELHDDFNFHLFVVESMEEDFSKMVEFEWLMWLLAAVWILLPYQALIIIWMPILFLLFQLLVGAKLESVIIQLATLAYTNYSPHFIPFKERKGKASEGRPNLFKRSATVMRNMLSRHSPKLRPTLNRLSAQNTSTNQTEMVKQSTLRHAKSLEQPETKEITTTLQSTLSDPYLPSPSPQPIRSRSPFAGLQGNAASQNGVEKQVRIDDNDAEKYERQVKRRGCCWVDVKTNRIVNRRLSQHFASKYLLKDAADLFWFRKPKILLRIFQYGYFQSGLVTAFLLLEKWRGGFYTEQETDNDAIAIVMIGVNLIVMVHAALFVLPMYALTTAAGSHCPEKVLKKALKKNVNPELALKLQLERNSFTRQGSVTSEESVPQSDSLTNGHGASKSKTHHHHDPSYSGPINSLLQAMDQAKARKRLQSNDEGDRPQLLRHSIGATFGPGQVTGRPIRALETLVEVSLKERQRSSLLLSNVHEDGYQSEPDLEETTHASLTQVRGIFELAEKQNVDPNDDNGNNSVSNQTYSQRSVEDQFKLRWLQSQQVDDVSQNEIQVVVHNEKEQQPFTIPMSENPQLQDVMINQGQQIEKSDDTPMKIPREGRSREEIFRSILEEEQMQNRQMQQSGQVHERASDER